MADAKLLVIGPLGEEYLPDAIRIHREGLGYTFNSQLGAEHLAFLYRFMAHDADCCVRVAVADGRTLGVISGTVDEGALKSRLLKSMSLGQIARMGIKVLVRPILLYQLVQGSIIAAPLSAGGHEVRAVLTAIAVERGHQNAGVGRSLVESLEDFFRSRGVNIYRLDTLADNERAARFYRRLRFQEAGRRAGSLIFLRTIGAQ